MKIKGKIIRQITEKLTEWVGVRCGKKFFYALLGFLDKQQQ